MINLSGCVLIELKRAFSQTMPTCVLRYCKSRSGRCPDANWSFFSFPPVGNKTRHDWIRFVQKERREEKWMPSRASKLCSKHFRNEDIKVGKTGRACLEKGSLPTEGNKEPRDARSETDGDDESDSKSASDDESFSKRVADDVLESKPIFDDTTEISLRTQVDKLQKQRIRQQAKMKKLDQQNQLLKRKLSNLKKFVIHLVKKNDLQFTGQMSVTPHK